MRSRARDRYLLNAFYSRDSFVFAKEWLATITKNEDPLQVVPEPLQDEWAEFAADSLTRYREHRRGWVYVAAYLPYPNVYKVGSTATTPAHRMQTLRTAGVLAPLVLVDHRRVVDRFACEAAAQRLLAAAKVEREFFRCSYQEASDAVSIAAQGVDLLWNRAMRAARSA